MVKNLLVLYKYKFSYLVILIMLFACGAPQTTPAPTQDVALVKLKKHIPKNVTTHKYIVGKFDPETDDKFVKINPTLADKPNMYMRQEAYSAF